MAPLSSLLRAIALSSLFLGSSGSLRGGAATHEESSKERDELELYTIEVGGWPTAGQETAPPPVTTAQQQTVTTTQTPPVTTQASNPAPSCPTAPFKTIIIGAGMAGLTAAKTLEESNVPNYVVLEQSPNRVGGRMRSVQFGGYTVEEGANWIAGGGRTDTTNPIKAFADVLGIQYYDFANSVVGYEKNSQMSLDAKVVEKQLEALDKAILCVDEISWGLYAEAEAKGFRNTPNAQSARESLTKCKWSPPVPGSFTENLETLRTDNDYLKGPGGTSTYNFGESTFWDYGKENNFVADPRGMEFIAKEFAAKYVPAGKIEFGKTVAKIDYAATSTYATVTTSDGCNYQAETVIFTPSLAVTEKMVAQTPQVFTPPLSPGPNTSPLEADSWVRIYYKFPTPAFWDTSAQWIIMGTDQRGEGVWLNYDYAQLYPGSGIISLVMDQTTLENALTKAGLQGQALTEQFAKTTLLDPLRQTYGNIPAPTDVLFTDWEHDPTSYGSWENFPQGKNMDGYYDYFTQRNGKLILSGSGSCLRYWGYTHGAYFAGERDAKWAMGLMDGNPQKPVNVCDFMGDF